MTCGAILGNPHPEWALRIAESSAQIIGFAFCGPGFGSSGQELPRGRQLFSLFVAEAQYGTGAGQALLDATAGGSPALLWVVKENPQAVAFYGRNGFEFDGAEQADAGAPGILDARMVR